jgi:hypothetical protein
MIFNVSFFFKINCRSNIMVEFLQIFHQIIINLKVHRKFSRNFSLIDSRVNNTDMQ